MNEETVLLSQSDVTSLITMKEVVDICDRTFKGLGDGTTINPTKINLDLGETKPFPPYQGFMNAMPAYVGWKDVAGIKWAGGFLGERKKLGLPYVTSLIMLINPQIGNFTAVLEGAHITNLRTGAQTAVALKYIKNTKKSITLGIYGAGMQGRTQTMAISELFEIEELTVYDINEDSSKAFAEEMKLYVKGKIVIAQTPELVAAQSDTIVCVTQSKEKFLKNEWVNKGTVVFPMGSYQECDNELILNADKIIVDHVEQCLHRGALKELSENGAISEESLFSTIGELAIKKKTVNDLINERIICIPIGTGAMDIAVAKEVVDRAIEKGIGSQFSFVGQSNSNSIAY